MKAVRWIVSKVNPLAVILGVCVLTVAAARVDISLGLAVLGVGLIATAWEGRR